MRTELRAGRRDGRQAFTMIELMVVVTIIAILMGGVFQLMSTVGQMNQRAETVARLERVQNAISGFYAEYGYYPPVPSYGNPDPWASNFRNDFDQAVGSGSGKEAFTSRCTESARNQPVEFEFPPVQALDKFINITYAKWSVYSPNTLLGPTAATIPKEEWQDVKLFKFGLLSYLLPRLEVIGFTGTTGINTDLEPILQFYESRQWKRHNPVSDVGSTRKSLAAQQVIENRAVARWLPNFEGIVAAGKTILGVNTHESETADDEGAYKTRNVYQGTKLVDVLAYDYNGQRYVLQYMSLRDGWDRDLFYYSPPPYQSYRLWSAGKDGKTIPPWIKMENLSAEERKWATEITLDDVARFDR